MDRSLPEALDSQFVESKVSGRDRVIGATVKASDRR